MNRGRASLLRVTTLAFAFAVPAYAANTRDLGVVGETPKSPYITSVRVIGRWEDSGRDGFVRLVLADVGTEHPKNLVWLQWIEQKHDDKLLDELVATKEILEISRVSLLGNVSTPSPKATMLLLSGKHVWAYCDFRVQIRWGKPGTYKAKFLQSGTAKNDCELDGNRLQGTRW